ncbi:Rhodanese-related sulfurtransferase [Halobacillus karajensis]|uniref:Molybdopterin biosynthesis protein MoeB n=1 Tax=Halobacillus karajensis TaxID=195088 RepID=A0A024P8S3_9BACI|nr:rhodanese-like domain-containing protein [Halobacillus karajensis]CDQ21394.1 molybdopterin biosynthesis protein MoeB [Halobacillus karajensis]CDQ25534.1 molybdopterin biosynthesis protein MoeB [Halobacillus karajensis]CDQ25805.1 molybdopterin biosynthesis protein MoeB [Halobacillus karajensis]SEI13895.1 Rhodanese-related sulfurtransferase [Halobacillus karajensis]
MSQIKEITPQQVEGKLGNNEDFTIIDVREDEEVAQGMVPTAKHIRLGDLPNKVEELPKAQEYVMVCRSGRRSMNAAEFMIEKGFRNVQNMEGGMLKWDGELVF